MKKHVFAKIDFILLALTSALLIIGLITLYSAANTSSGGAHNYFNRQLLFALFGMVLLLITQFLPFKVLQRSAYLFYALAMLALVLVLFFGVRGYGAERWLVIGSLRLQPSEPAKLATVLAVARYLSQPAVDINRFKHFAVTVAIILLPFLLIARQPDLGTSLVFLALLIPVLFWAGLNWFMLFVIIAPLLTAILSFNFYAFLIWMALLIIVLLISRRKTWVLIAVFMLHIFVGLATPQLWNGLRPYQKQRILTFANPESDPRGSGYQVIQSKVAIGSGGLWGKGFQHGTQTQLRFLPAQHTDFIFSVLGEEWGFMGVLTTLIVFLLFILYMLYIATAARSVFGSVTVIGITTVFFFHIAVNIGMTAGLAPVTGLPLPFISYGGSFLLTSLWMVGIVANISANRHKN